MARFLLDTDTLIDFSKHFEPVASRVHALTDSEDEVGVSPVQLTEFFSAVAPDHRQTWFQFFRTLSLWDITEAAAVRAGHDRYDFARKGQQLSTDDCLTAAVARQHAAILVTNNLRHFPMTGLVLISLREDPANSSVLPVN